MAASEESQVGVGTTRPYYKLHVGGGEGNRGGIGATDITITGIATVGVANSSSGALNVLGISTFKGDIDLIGSAGISTVRWDASKDSLVFQDNAYARFGTGEDLKIWHDGSNSYIQEAGTGGLIIYGTDETLAVFTDDGSVQLYNNDSKKLETTGLGITVYGDAIVSGVVTAARLKVTGISTFATNTVINSTSIKVGSAVSIHTDGNAAFAGIVTANDKIRAGVGFTVDANTGNVAISGITTVGGVLQVNTGIRPDSDEGAYLGDASHPFSSGHIGEVLIASGSNDGEIETATGNLTLDSAGGTVTVDDNLSVSGVSTFVGDATFTGNIAVGGNLNVTGDIIYDEITGRNLNITGITTLADQVNFGTSGAAATVAQNGNATFSGIVTASQFQGGGIGVGIGSTTAHVGYGFTYLDLKGPGVSTVYASATTGITTIYFQGGGGSSVGAAGTWQNDGAQGISTAKSVGINTVGVAVTALQGGEKGASSGIGQTFQGLYISNGMVVNDNALNGNHYIGTAFGGVMAGPVTVNGIITVDGNWAVV